VHNFFNSLVYLLDMGGDMNKRPYRWAVPPEIVPKVDQLLAEGHKGRKISRALGVHWQTIAAVKHRRGAYKGIPK
jgi:hypothetical protein